MSQYTTTDYPEMPERQQGQSSEPPTVFVPIFTLDPLISMTFERDYWYNSAATWMSETFNLRQSLALTDQQRLYFTGVFDQAVRILHGGGNNNDKIARLRALVNNTNPGRSPTLDNVEALSEQTRAQLTRIEELEARDRDSSERAQAAAERAAQAELQRQLAEKDVEERQKHGEELLAQIEILRAKQNEGQSELISLQEKLDALDLENKSLGKEGTTVRAEVDRLRGQIRALEVKLGEQKSDEDALEDALQQASENRAELEKALSDLSLEKATREEQAKRYEEQVRSTEMTLDEERRRREANEAALERRDARLQELVKEVEARRREEPAAVKELKTVERNKEQDARQYRAIIVKKDEEIKSLKEGRQSDTDRDVVLLRKRLVEVEAENKRLAMDVGAAGIVGAVAQADDAENIVVDVLERVITRLTTINDNKAQGFDWKKEFNATTQILGAVMAEIEKNVKATGERAQQVVEEEEKKRKHVVDHLGRPVSQVFKSVKKRNDVGKAVADLKRMQLEARARLP